MTKYLVLYRSTVSAMQAMASNTPEMAKAGMDAWMAWAQGAGEALVELGLPLQGLDAPADPNDIIAGYSILQAQDDDAARAVLEGHPHVTQWGGTIEVLRMLPLPGM